MRRPIVHLLIAALTCCGVAAQAEQKPRPQSKPSAKQKPKPAKARGAGVAIAQRGAAVVDTIWPQDVARAFADLEKATSAARSAGSVKEAEQRLIEAEKALMKARRALWKQKERGNLKPKKVPNTRREIGPARTFFQVFSGKF